MPTPHPKKIANVGEKEELENWDSEPLLAGMQNGAATLENSMVVPQKLS